MSLFPYIFRDMLRPLRMMEHQMRLAEEFFPKIRSGVFRIPYIEYSEDGIESVIQDKEKFQVKFNVKHFAPHEVTVKTVGVNSIVVEGKHEDKEDEKGFISRQFVRKFDLPKGHDLKSVISSLSANGILTITAPRNVEPEEPERVIPVTHEDPKDEKKE